jgi:hypothetical protein
MDTWQPLTQKELELLVASQLVDCSPEERQHFERCKINPRLTEITRAGCIESIFVVAQLRDHVVYYEDVEGGFNISSLSSDGAIATPSFEQWELGYALKQLVAA